MSDTLEPRWYHSTTTITLGSGLAEVTMFGGSPEPFVGSFDAQPKRADTIVLQFSKYMFICRNRGEVWERRMIIE